MGVVDLMFSLRCSVLDIDTEIVGRLKGPAGSVWLNYPACRKISTKLLLLAWTFEYSNFIAI